MRYFSSASLSSTSAWRRDRVWTKISPSSCSRRNRSSGHCLDWPAVDGVSRYLGHPPTTIGITAAVWIPKRSIVKRSVAASGGSSIADQDHRLARLQAGTAPGEQDAAVQVRVDRFQSFGADRVAGMDQSHRSSS